jgi:hypothetical protein
VDSAPGQRGAQVPNANHGEASPNDSERSRQLTVAAPAPSTRTRQGQGQLYSKWTAADRRSAAARMWRAPSLLVAPCPRGPGIRNGGGIHSIVAHGRGTGDFQSCLAEYLRLSALGAVVLDMHRRRAAVARREEAKGYVS